MKAGPWLFGGEIDPEMAEKGNDVENQADDPGNVLRALALICHGSFPSAGLEACLRSMGVCGRCAAIVAPYLAIANIRLASLRKAVGSPRGDVRLCEWKSWAGVGLQLR